MAHSVLVLGARGVLGSMLCARFEEAGWEVFRGARPLVDLDRSDTVERAIEGVEVVVNPVVHPAMAPERLVLRRGGLALNVSAGPVALARSLREEGRAGAAGTVVVSAGRIPGVTNLLAAEVIRAHPDADAVRIATTLSAGGSSGRAGGEFLHEHLTARSRHRTAVIPFPPPFGERRCFEIAEDEGGWLGDVAGAREVSTYACLAERPLTAGVLGLNRAGLMKAVPAAAFRMGRGGAPDTPSREPVAMWAGALRQGRLLGSRGVTCPGDYRSTAAITEALAAALLERAESAGPGVYDPEELFALADFEQAWRAVGIEVHDGPAS